MKIKELVHILCCNTCVKQILYMKCRIGISSIAESCKFDSKPLPKLNYMFKLVELNILVFPSATQRLAAISLY